MAEAPMAPMWPAVDWGMQPALNPQWTMTFDDGVAPMVFSLDSAKSDVVMSFKASEGEGLAPLANAAAPLSREVAASGPKESGQETGPLRLGDVSFNRAAESFNLGKKDATKTDDLSRQMGMAPATQNVVAPAPITGWTMIAIAALVVVVALVVGAYESDKDDRKRRRKARRRHRHSS